MVYAVTKLLSSVTNVFTKDFSLVTELSNLVTA
jgi:hypothetical protein